jgi:hypothetical protein
MKTHTNSTRLSFLCCALLLFVIFLGNAQDRTHNGFYLSMQAGPAFGYANANTNVGYGLRVSGSAYAFDFQIGGALRENTILHGNIGIKSIDNPTIEMGGYSAKTTMDFDEIMIGAGVTQYLKHNFFVTAVLGTGNFSLYDETENKTTETNNGFSYQLKAGKEWWISSRWALGAALEYGGTRTKDTSGSYEETWQSHRYSIRFTATRNGRK